MGRKPKQTEGGTEAPGLPAVSLKARMEALLGKRAPAPAEAHRDGRTAAPRAGPQPVSASAATTYVAPSRRGKRQMQTHVEAEMLQQLKQLALDHGTTQSALVVEALNDLFAKYGKPPVA